MSSSEKTPGLEATSIDQPSVCPGDAGDEALGFAHEHLAAEVSPAEDRRVLRKIDLVMLPIILVTYSLKFLDQQAMSYSSNFGLLQDMHINTSQYAWASGSILNLAILLFQPAAARILQLVPISVFVAGSVVAWGGLLMVTAAARSFAAISVLRVLLGFAEAGITPAMIILISMWYKRDGEQPGRQGAWFFGNAIAQMVGGLIGYGVGHIGSGDLAVGPWIWVFLIVGAVTFVWGLGLFVLLPDTPLTARFLSPAERVVAVARLRANQTGIINHTWKWPQCVECLLDVNQWLYCVILFLSAIPSGGVASFGSIVIQQFGFSSLNTTLLTIPLGAVQALSLLASAWLNGRFRNIRNLVSALSQVPALVGAVLLMTLPAPNKIGRLWAYYIIQTHTVNDVMVYAVFSGNTAGFTKKVTGAAMMFVFSSVGLVVGPQLFRAAEAPAYPTAFNAAISCFALQIVLPFVLQAHLYWLNRKKAAAQVGQPAPTPEELAQEGFMDRTDCEQPHFRYVY